MQCLESAYGIEGITPPPGTNLLKIYQENSLPAPPTNKVINSDTCLKCQYNVNELNYVYRVAVIKNKAFYSGWLKIVCVCIFYYLLTKLFETKGQQFSPMRTLHMPQFFC